MRWNNLDLTIADFAARRGLRINARLLYPQQNAANSEFAHKIDDCEIIAQDVTNVLAVRLIVEVDDADHAVFRATGVTNGGVSAIHDGRWLREGVKVA